MLRKETELQQYNIENTNKEDDKIKLQKSSEQILMELTIQIEKDIIEYSNINGLPLCEYLDYTNTKNFVKWLLSRQK